MEPLGVESFGCPKSLFLCRSSSSPVTLSISTPQPHGGGEREGGTEQGGDKRKTSRC